MTILNIKLSLDCYTFPLFAFGADSFVPSQACRVAPRTPGSASPSLVHSAPRKAEMSLGDSLAPVRAGQGCRSQDIAHHLNSKSRRNSFAWEQSCRVLELSKNIGWYNCWTLGSCNFSLQFIFQPKVHSLKRKEEIRFALKYRGVGGGCLVFFLHLTWSMLVSVIQLPPKCSKISKLILAGCINGLRPFFFLSRLLLFRQEDYHGNQHIHCFPVSILCLCTNDKYYGFESVVLDHLNLPLPWGAY